jgi:hypothetical protein
MPAELTQTINYTGLQQYIGEVQALLAPHRQKKKDPQKFANKIAAVVQKAYHLTRIGNEQPFMPAFAAEWISLFHNDGNLAKKFIYNPRSVFFPDKLKENFGNVPASKKTRASGGREEPEVSKSVAIEPRVSGSSKAAVAPEAATIGSGSEVIYKSQDRRVSALPLVLSRSPSAPPAALSVSSSESRSGPSAALPLGSRSAPPSALQSGSSSRLSAAPSSGPSSASSARSSSASSARSSLGSRSVSSSRLSGTVALPLVAQSSGRVAALPQSVSRVAPEQKKALQSEFVSTRRREDSTDSASSYEDEGDLEEGEVTENDLEEGEVYENELNKSGLFRSNIINLKKKIKEYEEDIILNNDLIKRKDALITYYQERNISIIKLNEEKKKLEKERFKLLEFIERLKKEIEIRLTEMDKLYDMLAKLKQKIIITNFKKFNLNRENKELQKEKENLQKEHSNLFKRIETLQENMRQKDFNINRKMKEILSLEKQQIQLEIKVNKFEEDLQACETAKNILKNQLGDLITRNNKNLQVIENLILQVKNNNIHNEDLNNQLDKELKINSLLNEKLKKTNINVISFQNMNIKVENQTKEIEYIKKKLETCTNNLRACELENNELKEQLLVCRKGVKSNNEKISTVRSSLRAAPTNPPPSSSSTFSVGQKQYVDSPINPNYDYSNKSLTSKQRSRVIIPLSQHDFSNSPQTKRNLKTKLENETKLNTTFFYPFNKTTQQQQICTPLGNNRLTIEQLKKIYIYYKNEMVERNKKLVQNLKMKSVEKDTPSYQEMCEDLQKLTKQQDDTCKREFIKKVQDAQSSATTTV